MGNVYKVEFKTFFASRVRALKKSSTVRTAISVMPKKITFS